MKTSSMSVEATMRRRVLINFRVDRATIAPLLPAPFAPRLVNGWGMAGICLIALDHVRPAGIPTAFGIHTENVAHRIAVEWSQPDGRHQGVYIPRRDTDSAFVHAMGGRIFPGVYHLGRFNVVDDVDHLQIEMRADDASTSVVVSARPAGRLTQGSIFGSLEDASRFFEVGTLGFSPDADGDCLDGLELTAEHWQVQPLAVDRVESSFFGDQRLFKRGSVVFDCALIMRDIPCRWRACDAIALPAPTGYSRPDL